MLVPRHFLEQQPKHYQSVLNEFPLPVKCPNTEFFWAAFPVFELNTEIYSVNLCIQSKYRKIRTV